MTRRAVATMVVGLLAWAPWVGAQEPRDGAALSQVARLRGGGPRACAALEAYATHASPVVREAAVRALGCQGAGASAARIAARLAALADDADPGVSAAAVQALVLDRGASGIAALRAVCAANEHRAFRLRPAIDYAARLLVHRELDALMPADGWIVGTYPDMFAEIEPLGAWAAFPLIDCFWPSTARRVTPRQQLAGEALAVLAPQEALADLQRIYAVAITDRRQRDLAELAAVALARLPLPDVAPLQALETEYRNREGRPYFGRAGTEAKFRLGMLYLRQGKTRDAAVVFEAAATNPGGRLHHIRYNLACIYAMVARPDEALSNLALALDAGFDSPGWIARDGRLDPLRSDPRFAPIAAREPGVREPESGED